MSQPAAAVGALYDTLLQSALRQFFDRAALDTEPTPAPAPDGRLAIEPSANPAALIIKWFGTRYTLRVPGRWLFTSHEVRLAQAIGAVLQARYRAILNPQVIAERGDLFRGAIEDRYVGAFLDPRPYAIESREARADLIASIIELLRVAALSSYENRPITTGVLLLSTADDPLRSRRITSANAPAYTQSLTGIKSFYRLADGVNTVFLANAEGRLVDIIDIERWSASAAEQRQLAIACARTYHPHARATAHHGHVCAVLTPSREIKVFADGAEVFTFRGAAWHLLDLQAKSRLWTDAVGNDTLATRLFQTALDLADAREGALFVVLRDPASLVSLVAPADRLDVPMPPGTTDTPSRRDLLHLLEGRLATELDSNVFSALASIDGATVVDRAGRLLAGGAILRHPLIEEAQQRGVVEGARTTAALAASRFGPVLKVSEDGVITFFDRERVWDI
ncbi:MAG TPA: hypothetical protein VFV95_11185 [Vicinamibacterales bacterium]|nr:hypothetical protein [Vicinamibacterales bacterium]